MYKLSVMNNLPCLIKVSFLTAFFSCSMLLHSQNIEQRLVEWNSENPIQKTYLHLDRNHYFSGQTIWFKAYYMSDFLPSASNSTLFVELLNNQSTVILKKVLPVFGALSQGQVEIPDTLGTGSYQLRAYTPLMLNHNKNYLFSKRVNIYGREKRAATTTITPDLKVQFFPEGGNLVTGLANNVAFKAVDANGLPVDITGTIKDSKNGSVGQVKTLHDGMGIFQLTPEAGETYYAEINGEKFPIPNATPNRIAIQIKNVEGNLNFTLQKSQSSTFQPAYMIGQMQHQVVFKHEFNSDNKNTINGQIPTGKLPSGVLQIAFFNKDGAPLAERLAFIDNKEYLLPASFETAVVNTGKRKFNDYSISLEDSITGNFSISVTDADYETAAPRPQNIISSFLLTSDIPGYVHNPAWYFSGAENASQALDLVMQTNGWRRFKWTDVANNSLAQPVHQDKGYISLSGRASIKGSKKSFADRELMIWVATPDSARSLQLVKTDSEGRFKMDSMIFFDKAKVLFSDVMGDKSKFITVDLDTDSLNQSYALPNLNIPYKPWNGGTTSTLSQNMNAAYVDYRRGQGLMLDNVLVKGNKTRMDQLEEIYMSGLFAGGINARTYDLTREFMPQWNIFEYLQGRVPGLWIERRGGFMNDYGLYYRQGGVRRQMQIYLDEMLMQDASFISSIPTNDIALVKIFPTFVGAPGGGANGVIAIYTKRGVDPDDYTEGTGDILDYDGYSIIKEFYAPDYSQKVEGSYTDYRLTLDWKPEVFVSGKDKEIPIKFYNNDRTKRFKIVAEGITSDGKLLMIEKTVEAEK